MLSLEYVQATQDAHVLYDEATHCFDRGMIMYIEKNPQEMPEDTPKVRAAKKAYRLLQSFYSDGAVRRLQLQSEIA